MTSVIGNKAQEIIVNNILYGNIDKTLDYIALGEGKSFYGLYDGVVNYTDTQIIPSNQGEIEIIFSTSSLSDSIIIGSFDGNNKCYLGITNKKISCGIGSLQTSKTIGKTVLEVNKSYKAKIIWTGLTVTLYLNDIIEFTTSIAGKLSSTKMSIGSCNNAGTNEQFFNGKINSVKYIDSSVTSKSFEYDYSEQFGGIDSILNDCLNSNDGINKDIIESDFWFNDFSGGNYSEENYINGQFVLTETSNVQANASNQILFKYDYTNNSGKDRKIKEVGLIQKSKIANNPIMKSNVLPEGLCFAQNINTTAISGAIHFSDNVWWPYSSLSTYGIRGFADVYPVISGYIDISKRIVNRYSFSSSNISSTLAKKWYFEGSNDTINGSDGNWEILDYVDRTGNQLKSDVSNDFYPKTIKEMKSFRIRVIEGEIAGFGVSLLKIRFYEDSLFSKFETDNNLKIGEKWINTTKLTVG